MTFFRESRIHLLLVISSVLVALVLAELGLALFRPESYMAPPQSSSGIWRELLHRPSSTPGLVYELAPNMEKFSRGMLIKTNSYGMRDLEPVPVEDSSVFRILVLGDSFTFGFGVEGRETYPSILEDTLNQSHAMTGRQFDVLNFGVGGYSTRDEAIQLKYKGLAWKPDLVIIGYVLNDPEVAPIQPLHRHFQKVAWWQHFHLLRLMAKTKRIAGERKYGDGDYIEYLHADEGPAWPTVVEAFREISRMVRDIDTEVLVVIFPLFGNRLQTAYPYQAIHRQVASMVREYGFGALDLYPAFEQAGPDKLILSPDDGHPNRLGHFVAAKELYKRLLADYPELLARNVSIPQGNATF